MSKELSNSYMVIQGWMRTKLDLKGNDLMVYAIIYGFSQAEGTSFTGSVSYLMNWTGASRRTIFTVLGNLVEKGLVIKTDRIINGINFPIYDINHNFTPHAEITPPPVQNLHYPHAKIAPNNIDNNLGIDNIENIREGEEKSDDIPYEDVRKYFNEFCVTLPHVEKISDRRRKAIKACVNEYGLEDVKLAIRKTNESDFLSGASKQWKASFDWLFVKNNMLKVIEGNYSNSHSRTARQESKYEQGGDYDRFTE